MYEGEGVECSTMPPSSAHKKGAASNVATATTKKRDRVGPGTRRLLPFSDVRAAAGVAEKSWCGQLPQAAEPESLKAASSKAFKLSKPGGQSTPACQWAGRF